MAGVGDLRAAPWLLQTFAVQVAGVARDRVLRIDAVALPAAAEAELSWSSVAP